MQKLCTKMAQGISSRIRFSALGCRELSQTKALSGATTSENDGSTNASPGIKWEKLYHMEQISYLSIVSRLKLYKGIASATLLPAAYIGELLNHLPDGVTTNIIAISFSTMSMLCIYSGLVSNTIGLIHVCSKNENIRFAYLNFWGKRNHYDTTINNVGDASGENFGLYQTVRFRDGTKTFKLATRYGNVSDYVLFEKLFGRHDK